MSAFEKDYREKIQDARRLSDSGNHDGAVEELDSLNWHKIHNISSIVQASEIYSDAGRDEDAKDLLLMAHNRSGVGRVVLFHLCELTIKMGQLDEAKEYYEDFVEAAPNDYQRYVLKYYLEQKRGADDYTLIGILEELKDAEFLDDWAYQLAYLYHKTNQAEAPSILTPEFTIVAMLSSLRSAAITFMTSLSSSIIPDADITMTLPPGKE